jgi:hypothetical protein
MSKIDKKYCLRMARSLDAKAAGTRDDSYLRKLLEDQAAKYRTDAGKQAATGAVASTPTHVSSKRFADGCYFFRFGTGAT